MSAARALFAALALAVLVLACGSPRPAPQLPRPPPRFEDALDGVPDAVLVVRPRELRDDPVFGPLWRRAVRAALVRGLSAHGERMLVAVEGADAIVLALPRTGEDGAALALRGVRADLDPVRVLDERGQPMWQEAATNGLVTEYARIDPPPGERVVLFVLPNREWVFVFGAGAARARAGFAAPGGRPRLDDEQGAVALFRMRGPAVVREVRALRTPGSALAPLGQRLTDFTVALAARGRGVVIGLRYLDDESASGAEQRLRQVVKLLADAKEPGGRFAWLREAAVDRDGAAVRLRAPLPLRLLEDLPSAGSAPIDL